MIKTDKEGNVGIGTASPQSKLKEAEAIINRLHACIESLKNENNDFHSIFSRLDGRFEEQTEKEKKPDKPAPESFISSLNQKLDELHEQLRCLEYLRYHFNKII